MCTIFFGIGTDFVSQVAASRSLHAWWVENNRPQATIQVKISLDENQPIMYLSAGGSRGASHREAAQD